MFKLLPTLSLVLGALALPNVNDDGAMVKSGGGIFVGNSSNGISGFYGIPYAKPPYVQAVCATCVQLRPSQQSWQSPIQTTELVREIQRHDTSYPIREQLFAAGWRVRAACGPPAYHPASPWWRWTSRLYSSGV